MANTVKMALYGGFVISFSMSLDTIYQKKLIYKIFRKYINTLFIRIYKNINLFDYSIISC